MCVHVYEVLESCLCDVCGNFYYFFFFFKQKTAYEMRISDWSSDVCSSDLHTALPATCAARRAAGPERPVLRVQWRPVLHRPGRERPEQPHGPCVSPARGDRKSVV